MGAFRNPATIDNTGTLGGTTNPTTSQALPMERENQRAIRELVGAFGYEALTIASGSITPTKAEITVDTEAGASADDLTTILLVSDGSTTLHDGMLLKLRAYDPARVVTVKHGSGTNQIQTISGTDIVLGTTWELTLKLQSGVWKEIAGKPVVDITGNAATATDLASGSVLSVAKGGTGATTAVDARTNLSVYSKAEVDTALLNALPVGAIFDFAGTAAPTGSLIADGSAISRTAYANLFAVLVTAPGFIAQTFTVTIATPAVFTKSGHGFIGGERLRLSTTGALPTGLSTSADYFVEVIDANTFYLLNAAVGGSRINTSGTQSGTHRYLRSLYGLGDGSTTFNTPDFRGEFRRGADLGRGVDTGRVVGSFQADTLKAHTHTYSRYIASASLQRASGTSNTGGYDSPETSATGDAETRPRNVAVVSCIKY